MACKISVLVFSIFVLLRSVASLHVNSVGSNLQPVILSGQCDDSISLLKDFDVNKFTGSWRAIYSYYSETLIGKCPKAQYTLGDDGVVNVVNSQVILQTLATISGTAVVADEKKAKLAVTIEIVPGVNATQNLWVIDTDYDNWAISYSCQNLSGNKKRVFSWILSREEELSEPAQSAVDKVVNSVSDLDYKYFDKSDQSFAACFYYPEPNPSKIVEFPGKCDDKQPTVQFFNLTRYMGLWYDVESYPNPAEGSCNSIFYKELYGGAFETTYKVVRNNILYKAKGEAKLDSDGEAKFVDTYPVIGTDEKVTTTYWILDTDYTSYSLVYSCTYKPSTDTRQIFSWKFSREKTLSKNAQINIDITMRDFPYLDDRYFVERDQSDKGCAYSEEVDPS